MNKLFMFLVSMICLNMTVYAGVSVSPVQLYITGEKQRTATLTLESKNETTNRIFEVKAYKWTQDNLGQDILELDTSLMVNPKNFILKSDSSQTIRAGFLRPIESILVNGEESAWRLIVEEMPSVTKDQTVSFLVNFNMPLFVGAQDDLNTNFKIKEGKLVVNNQAKSHIQIHNLRIVNADKKEVFKFDTMFYLLAGKTRSLDLNNVRLGNLSNYKVLLNTDKDDKEIELPLSN